MKKLRKLYHIQIQIILIQLVHAFVSFKSLGINIFHVILLTFSHSINQSDWINSPSINQSYLICRYRGRMQEFKSSTSMYFIFLFHIATTFQMQVFHCAIKYLRVTQTIEARIQEFSEGDKQHVLRNSLWGYSRSKFFGSRLKCIMQMN